MPDLHDQTEQEQLDEVAAVFSQFTKSLKTIGLYRHNVTHFHEYMEPTYAKLSAALDRYGTLAFKVEQLGLKFKNTWVYQEDASEQNMGFKFYRDGIRFINFRPGLEANELLQLTEILLVNLKLPEYSSEDTVSLLWRADFSHIEYVVVENYAVGDEDEEAAREEVDRVVEYLYKRLGSNSDDTFGHAHLSLEDLEVELEGVQQAKGVVIKGSPASREQLRNTRQVLDEENVDSMLPKLVVILFKVLEEPIDDQLGETLEDVFAQLLDSFLIHGDFSSINRMMNKLASLERKRLPGDNLQRLARITETMIERMGEAERLDGLGAILDSSSEISQSDAAYEYLTRLDTAAIEPMLQTLEHMERPEARQLFCDALVYLGKERLESFVRRLSSKKSNLVRDMLYVIDRLNPPDKLKIISRLLKHPNLAIRLDTLSTLGKSGDKRCLRYVMEALSDSDMQMRISAASLLNNFELEMATNSLMEMVASADFQRRDPREQAAIMAALANTNSTRARDYFITQLRASGRLNKKKLIDQKRIVINGLALSGSIGAYKLLRAELEIGFNEDEVTEAATRAAAALKKKLLGS